jgi:hypothetical protein
VASRRGGGCATATANEQRVGHGTPASTLTSPRATRRPRTTSKPASIPARDRLLKPLLRPFSRDYARVGGVPMRELSDEDLVEEARAGNDAAFADASPSQPRSSPRGSSAPADASPPGRTPTSTRRRPPPRRPPRPPRTAAPAATRALRSRRPLAPEDRGSAAAAAYRLRRYRLTVAPSAGTGRAGRRCPASTHERCPRWPSRLSYPRRRTHPRRCAGGPFSVRRKR